MLQRYEDLTYSAEKETSRMFEFCELPFTTQTQDFLRISQQVHIENEYAVFKRPNTAERWRAELQPEICDSIMAEIVNSAFSRFAA